ncbi:MAG: hypothetical protein A3C02_03200 [Candidatus Andersenbacteria bacterium RIFCSPHIGHO2_02_FULL_45_11]|uniref:Proline--tRNA ligase n=1 Tax=Candidatus Andersenbacteria bacterium RIFCSPHIGHO2_12_FULL_45_11 TaxID=1797281 RepID=A0A1G1X546_9BACT|nr:MAG: hypothetical protein A2805_01855 [Candidatus Andersenbacteria bacterium RIFCSPHIGHO2_01_FULL_46_36]OGY34015.1 MAG: hypothetical protein A3C02_03200 [Candidatus Andersenbacteria bacterium RIFCSPHIGHO2_02_FULL_45_11]OGY35142.1 MAG: hypothetical protein A3D99_00170 [Candidatus Andersenbacteria bacterium RIFCSPHIGHO2_12_FULL_45_11]QBM02245.1 proline--tRNA ligase [uncultured archaeon]
MKYSSYYLKTNKEAKSLESINATLLQKGGFVEQVMAGVYAFLPIGLRVLNKIETIVREEMDKVGSELLLPALSPKSLWEQSGRLNTIDVLFEVRGANDLARAKNSASYILNPTQEEIMTTIVRHYAMSYKDLPLAVYQIQTKFRSEPRAKSGLMRGREFRMKDLYSFHETAEDLDRFYDEMKSVYARVFDRMGLGHATHLTLAGGGDFTSNFSHEFQTVCETGEDIIFYDEKEKIWKNKEVASEELQKTAESVRASEVGNIYRFGTKYSDSFDHIITQQNGDKSAVHTGSYGIGTSRLMGVLVEKFHDEKGIMWPESVAPFTVYLAGLNRDDDATIAAADAAYTALEEAGVETLYDDRDTGTGAKFADAELLGIPWRVVVSKKTAGKLEVTSRATNETHLLEISEFLKKAGK